MGRGLQITTIADPDQTAQTFELCDLEFWY